MNVKRIGILVGMLTAMYGALFTGMAALAYLHLWLISVGRGESSYAVVWYVLAAYVVFVATGIVPSFGLRRLRAKGLALFLFTGLASGFLAVLTFGFGTVIIYEGANLFAATSQGSGSPPGMLALFGLAFGLIPHLTEVSWVRLAVALIATGIATSGLAWLIMRRSTS